jgi:fructoselysine-6-P-deglycase FrlB-like protein
VTELTAYVERAKRSDYFSGARLPGELRAFMETQEDSIRAIARDLGSVDHVFLVGSGGSYSNLLSAKYVFDRLLPMPSDALPSYELLWRAPRLLTDRSVVFLASMSGDTEDTVEALRFARSQGARTVSVVGTLDSRLGREADHAIPYGSAACYEGPLVGAIVLGAALAGADAGSGLGDELIAGLHRLPETIERVMHQEEERAEAKARAFLGSTHVFVLGAGPLSALAYKFAMSVLMENVRIAGTYSDAVEFRHGPVEALERIRPDFVALVGTDESRAVTLRTLEFCQPRSSRFLVYDAAEYGDVHPLLTPLVLNSVLQWFVVYSALLRGILDLDERVFMGHGLLAAGEASWP